MALHARRSSRDLPRSILGPRGRLAPAGPSSIRGEDPASCAACGYAHCGESSSRVRAARFSWARSALTTANGVAAATTEPDEAQRGGPPLRILEGARASSALAPEN